MSNVPYVWPPHLSPYQFLDEEISGDEEVVIPSEKAGAKRKQPMREKAEKKKNPTWGKLSDGLSARIEPETKQKGEQDITDNQQASILSIYAEHYVVIASVGV